MTGQRSSMRMPRNLDTNTTNRIYVTSVNDKLKNLLFINLFLLPNFHRIFLKTIFPFIISSFCSNDCSNIESISVNKSFLNKQIIHSYSVCSSQQTAFTCNVVLVTLPMGKDCLADGGLACHARGCAQTGLLKSWGLVPVGWRHSLLRERPTCDNLEPACHHAMLFSPFGTIIDKDEQSFSVTITSISQADDRHECNMWGRVERGSLSRGQSELPIGHLTACWRPPITLKRPACGTFEHAEHLAELQETKSKTDDKKYIQSGTGKKRKSSDTFMTIEELSQDKNLILIWGAFGNDDGG